MTDDTAAILAALDSVIVSLVRVNAHDAPNAWPYGKEVTILRALRSRIEKERPFLEAAMAYCRSAFQRSGETSLHRDRLHNAYRALVSEKPPEDFDVNKAWFAALRQNPEAATMREKPPEDEKETKP